MNVPTIETYRGVGIHDFQSPQRIAEVVRPAIDAVFAMSDVDELWSYLTSCAHPPEARALAGALLKATSEAAADKRLPRPKVSLEGIDAICASVSSLKWVAADCYSSDLDPDHTGAATRPVEFQNALAEYLKRSA